MPLFFSNRQFEQIFGSECLHITASPTLDVRRDRRKEVFNKHQQQKPRDILTHDDEKKSLDTIESPIETHDETAAKGTTRVELSDSPVLKASKIPGKHPTDPSALADALNQETWTSQAGSPKTTLPHLDVMVSL